MLKLDETYIRLRGADGLPRYSLCMNLRGSASFVGKAIAGTYIPAPNQSTIARTSNSPGFRATRGMTLDVVETFLNREEQRLYDWVIGIMEDAGVVGVLKNVNLYSGSTLQGEIDTGVNPGYWFALSRTSAEFGLLEGVTTPLAFETVTVETSGDDIEAGQVRRAFNLVRCQSAYLRSWRESTSLATLGSTAFRQFRLLNGSEMEMILENDFGEYTVRVRATVKQTAFEYSVIDNRLGLQCTPRVADALLSDAADDTGADPDPASIVCAMTRVADLARSDIEWLAASENSASRRWS